VWLTTFVLFDSIKFELICSFDKHSVDLMISAPVAEHQLLVFLGGLVKIPLAQVPLAGKLKSLL
jgi:hypothetical protein